MFSKIKEVLFDLNQNENESESLSEKILGRKINETPSNLNKSTITNSHEYNIDNIDESIKDSLIIPTIDEIYKTKDISNEHSIYKVLNFDKTLPDTITKEMRKDTLKKIIEVSGLNVFDLEQDYMARTATLIINRDQIIQDCNNVIQDLEHKIQCLENNIKEHQNEISKKIILSNSVNVQITEELAHLEKIRDMFI